MANGVSAPFGLRPIKTSSFGIDVSPNNNYEIYPTYGTSIYEGQPVSYIVTGPATGFIGPWPGDTTPIIGTFAGIEVLSAGSGPSQNPPQVYNNWYQAGLIVPAGSVIRARVYDAPDIVFEVQTNNSTGFARSNIFQCYTMTAASGNNTTGICTMMLDQATGSAPGAGATSALKPVGMPLNNNNGLAFSPPGLGYNIVWVQINNHQKRPGQVGQ